MVAILLEKLPSWRFGRKGLLQVLWLHPLLHRDVHGGGPANSGGNHAEGHILRKGPEATHKERYLVCFDGMSHNQRLVVNVYVFCKTSKIMTNLL